MAQSGRKNMKKKVSFSSSNLHLNYNILLLAPFNKA